MSVHFIDKAIKYRKAMKNSNLTQLQCCKKFKTGQANFSNHIRLLKLDTEVLKNIKYFGLKFKHSLRLVKIDKYLSKKQIIKLVQYGALKELNVEKFAKYIDYEMGKQIERCD